MRKVLTSTDNPVVKKTALLNDRKHRKAEGLFLFEGEKLAREALSCGIRVSYAFASERFMGGNPELIRALEASGALLYQVTDAILKKACDSVSPQGILCVAGIPRQNGEPDLLPNGNYLALQDISDPGNIGAIMRSAEAFGIDAVLLSRGCADPYSPKTVRGSMGSLFRIPQYIIDDMQKTVYTLKEKGFIVYAAALTGTAVDVRNAFSAEGGYVALIGNEGAGLPHELADACSARLYVPMAGQAESLNAAVAASVVMWEMAGRRV